MKIQIAHRSFFVYLLIFLLLPVLGTDTVFAYKKKTTKTSEVKIADPVKDATVNLYCRLKYQKKIYSTSGSGVFISDRGVILTNAHVAEFFLIPGKDKRVTGWCSVRDGSPAREKYEASVLYLPSIWIEQNAEEMRKNQPKGTGENDFALLYITGAKKGALPEKFPFLPLNTPSKINESDEVVIAGYPIEKLNFSQIRNDLDFVSAKSTILNIRNFKNSQLVDVITLAPSEAGSGGVSGGPIVNSKNEILGIITSKSAAKGDRTTRGITLSYIDRTLQSLENDSLGSILAGDLKARSDISNGSFSPEIIKIIVDALFKIK